MRNRYVAAIAAVALLAGGGGTYAYTHYDAASAPHARTAAAPVPLNSDARYLSHYKADASANRQARHAKATAERKAAARRAAQGYEPATDPADNGWTPRTPVGQPCDGDPSSYHVTQPDGTCSGPVHFGPKYFDNQGNPCVPGDQPCSDDDVMAECPYGAATSSRCARLIKGGEAPNMQPPKCGDGSTEEYLRDHGVRC